MDKDEKKYVAYTDLTGSGYFPTNIPARRPMVVGQPTGLVFNKPKGHPVTAATLQLDGLLTTPRSHQELLQARPFRRRQRL